MNEGDLWRFAANGVAAQRAVDNKLYDIAKKITLEAGFPYYDPRTRQTTYPRLKRITRKRKLTKKEAAKNNKIRQQVEKEFPPLKKGKHGNRHPRS